MINNVTLVGRLTKDAKKTTTKGGITVATFTLAVDRPYTNANGQREADFIHCVIWRKPAENLAKFSSKGKLIGIEGRIQTRNYEDENHQRVYVTEVLVRDFSLLEKKETVQSNNNGLQQTSNTAPTQAPINGQQQQTSNTAPTQAPINGQQQQTSNTAPAQAPINGQQQQTSNTAPAQAPINCQQQQTSNTSPTQAPINGQGQTKTDELDFSNVFEDEGDFDEEELPF